MEEVETSEKEGPGVEDRVTETQFDTVLEGGADRVEETEEVRQRVEEELVEEEREGEGEIEEVVQGEKDTVDVVEWVAEAEEVRQRERVGVKVEAG